MEAAATVERLDAEESHWICRSVFQMIVIAVALLDALLIYLLLRNATLWIVIPLVLLISHLMHGAAVGFHEASHGLLRRNRRFNEFDGVLLGIMSLMSLTLYRAAHQSHHMHLATERDEELWPYVVPGMPRWKRVLAAMLELNCGLLFTPFLFLRTFLRKGSPIRSARVRRRIWTELAGMALFWTVVVSLVAWFGVWRYFLWVYLLPMALAANMQNWRKYVEHIGMPGGSLNNCTRSIIAEGWSGKLTALSLLHEPYHGVHHKRSGLHHYEMPRHKSDLLPAVANDVPPFRSYGHALRDLIKRLPDPHVGHRTSGTPVDQMLPQGAEDAV